MSKKFYWWVVYNYKDGSGKVILSTGVPRLCLEEATRVLEKENGFELIVTNILPVDKHGNLHYFERQP